MRIAEKYVDRILGGSMSSKCAQCPAVAAILALIAGIFAIDWWLPQHLAITVLYVVPVLIASRISFQWLLPGVATLTSFLTLMEVARTPFYLLTWTAVCNRSFTLLVIWVTAHYTRKPCLSSPRS
jgi:hypothetical protein